MILKCLYIYVKVLFKIEVIMSLIFDYIKKVKRLEKIEICLYGDKYRVVLYISYWDK